MKWAIAANRADLLEKKLSCITKYYLCSEHFSDDCFSDPPNNTRLNKSLYPLSIPVPTIFKCNIDKYIPNSKRSADETDSSEESEHVKRTPNYGSISDFSMNRTKEGISLESLSVFHDHHYNYPDISSCSASFFNDIEVSINDLSNENSFDNIVDCDPLTNITEDIQRSFLLCRLCAKTYSSTEHLTDLTTKPGIYETLNTLLPNQVNAIAFNENQKIIKLIKFFYFSWFCFLSRSRVMTIYLN